MKKLPTLFFYCHHSRGIGHLMRSLAVGSELTRSFKVVFLIGGKMPESVVLPRNIQFIKLPPIGFDNDFQIVSQDSRYNLERAIKRRVELISNAFQRLEPQVILIEYFPFGRLYLSGELLTLLESARNMKAKRPLVLCTLRDLLEDSNERQQVFDDLACVLCNHLYDAVLVHSDPRFARLEETFHSTSPLRIPVHYTGLVCSYTNDRPIEQRRRARSTNLKRSDVIVSVGGGRVGGALLLAAAEAYVHHGIGAGIRMMLSTGPFLPENEAEELRSLTREVPGLKVVGWIENIESQFRKARVSVSQCGYNTSLALLRARVPALVVPFATPRDKEQMYRARKMERLGAVRVLDPSQLSGKTLAMEIRTTLEFRPRPTDLEMDGARNSARLVAKLFKEKASIHKKK